MKANVPVVIKKRNPFQKHKNAEAERKKKQDEEEAKVLAEFEETFGADDSGDGAAQPVRRGRGFGAHQASRAQHVRGDGSDGRGAMPASAPSRRMTWQPAPEQTADAPEAAVATQPSAPPAAKGGKKQIDVVLEKLKGEKAQREDRRRVLEAAGMEHLAGPSAEASDRHSTNLYVSNLYRTVDERALMEAFGRYGPLASVKIMWPRSEEERLTKTHNSGFVAFMTRRDAEAACQALHGSMLHGAELRVSHSKSVAVPRVPIYPPSAGVQGRGPPLHGRGNGGRGPHSWGRGLTEEEEMHQGTGAHVTVLVPPEERVRFIIDTLVRFIVTDGTDFEQLILEAEHTNPEFEFLRNVDSPEHMYYRWRLYSLCSGDSMAQWRTEPFVMIAGSNRLTPPQLNAGTVEQPATAAQRGAERDRDVELSDLERERLEDLLRGLRVERSDIQAAMLFALDHAAAAAEIAECLVASLTLSETPLHLKVARLYLLSDILHNSTASVRNASRYRYLIQAELPHVFASFRAALLDIDEDLKREAFKRYTLRVLRVWRDWLVFSEDFLSGLQATFQMQPQREWRTVFHDLVEGATRRVRLHLQEWLEQPDLERTCKHAGVVYDEEDRDVTIDNLVASHAFTLYGASGPPRDVLDAARQPPSQREPHGGAAEITGGPTASGRTADLGLLAGYQSASDDEAAGSKRGEAEAEATTARPLENGASSETASAPGASVLGTAERWESITAPEGESGPGKSMSQWLFEKQAAERAEADARAQEAAVAQAAAEAEAAAAAAAAAERVRLMEAEEARLQAAHEAAAAAQMEAWRQEEMRRDRDEGTAQRDVTGEVEAGEVDRSEARASEQQRQLMRSIEIKVVELQEDLEERGKDAASIRQQCTKLRTDLLARAAAGEDIMKGHTNLNGRSDDRSSSRARRTGRDGAGEGQASGHSRSGFDRAYRRDTFDSSRTRHKDDARTGLPSERDRGARARSERGGWGGRDADDDSPRRESSRSSRRTPDRAFDGSRRRSRW